MKMSQLLHARSTLVRQAALANLAFAHQTLCSFGERIARSGLGGRVNFKTADPDAERYWATLTALDASQAVVEEHFTEEDLTDFADAIAFATGRDEFDLTFRLEDFASDFLAPLRTALENAGIVVDSPPVQIEERSSSDHSEAGNHPIA